MSCHVMSLFNVPVIARLPEINYDSRNLPSANPYHAYYKIRAVSERFWVPLPVLIIFTNCWDLSQGVLLIYI